MKSVTPTTEVTSASTKKSFAPCPMPGCGSDLVGTGRQPCGVETVCCGGCGLSVPATDDESACARWEALARPALSPEAVAALWHETACAEGLGTREHPLAFARAIEKALGAQPLVALKKDSLERRMAEYIVNGAVEDHFDSNGPDYRACAGCGNEIQIDAFQKPKFGVELTHRDDCLYVAAQAVLDAPVKPESDPASVQPELTVWYGSLPESNGRSNFTAVLMRKGASSLIEGIGGGMTISQSEYPERVRYEGDCVRFLIGELADEPCIVDYDANAHSDYVDPSSAATDFERGYFCAVSTALHEDGSTSLVRSLFNQGGDPTKADPLDVQRFIEHGLMPSAIPQAAAASALHANPHKEGPSK